MTLAAHAWSARELAKRVAARPAHRVESARPGDPGRLHYAVVGIITTSIVFAKEYSRMTGLDPLCSAEVEQVVNLACELMGLPSTTPPPIS
jgi:hypothetical protein